MGSSGKKVGYLVAAVFVCLAAIVLVAVSFGTDYWIKQDYQSGNSTTSSFVYFNMGIFRGQIQYFSLFRGGNTFKVKDYRDVEGFMNFGLWVSTILSVALGVLFGIVTVVFSIVNSFTTPIEEITGITGLYLWNNLSCLFTMVGMFLYVGQYFGYFQHVLQALQPVEPSLPYVGELSSLGYSFYLVVGATALYLCNNLSIFMSTYKVINSKPLPDNLTSKGETSNGAILLY